MDELLQNTSLVAHPVGDSRKRHRDIDLQTDAFLDLVEVDVDQVGAESRYLHLAHERLDLGPVALDLEVDNGVLHRDLLKQALRLAGIHRKERGFRVLAVEDSRHPPARP